MFYHSKLSPDLDLCDVINARVFHIICLKAIENFNNTFLWLSSGLWKHEGEWKIVHVLKLNSEDALAA